MPELMILTGLFAVLTISGLIADHILPRIEPINRFIDSLPMIQDDYDDNDIETMRKEYAA